MSLARFGGREEGEVVQRGDRGVLVIKGVYEGAFSIGKQLRIDRQRDWGLMGCEKRFARTARTGQDQWPKEPTSSFPMAKVVGLATMCFDVVAQLDILRVCMGSASGRSPA